jgi:hypothetical protein
MSDFIDCNMEENTSLQADTNGALSTSFSFSTFLHRIISESLPKAGKTGRFGLIENNDHN